MYRVVFALFVITFLLDLQETSNEKLRTKKNHLRKFGQLFINFWKWKSHSSLPRFILIIFVSESRWKYKNTELYFRETKLVNGAIYIIYILYLILYTMYDKRHGTYFANFFFKIIGIILQFCYKYLYNWEFPRKSLLLNSLLGKSILSMLK